MKKKVIAVVCILISVFTAIGILCFRYISSERKADEQIYVSAAKTVAYELKEYLENGDKYYFTLAAADIVEMNKLSGGAKNIINENQMTILNNLAVVVEFDEDRLIGQAQRLYDAFKIIGENSDDKEYAYTQIKIAMSNCGL